MSAPLEDLRCIPADQAADLLAVSVDAIHDLVNRGDLAAVRVGRRVAIPVTALEAFITTGGSK